MKELRTSAAFFPHRPKVSLARALSKLGYCSRARALEMIEEGRVKVNRLRGFRKRGVPASNQRADGIPDQKKKKI